MNDTPTGPTIGDKVLTDTDGGLTINALDTQRAGGDVAPRVHLVNAEGDHVRWTESAFLIRTGPNSWRERLPRAGTEGGLAPDQVLAVGDVFHGEPLPENVPDLHWAADMAETPGGQVLYLQQPFAEVGEGRAWVLEVTFADRLQGETLRPVIREAAQRIMAQPGARIPTYQDGYEDGCNETAGYQFGERELATVLGSLRALQAVQQHQAPDAEIIDILTDGGKFAALDDGEVDALCEALNQEGATLNMETQLRRLLANGMEHGAATSFLNADLAAKDPSLQAYRDAVQTKEGALECDQNAVVSVSEDGGAYVQTWTWVYVDAAGITRDE